MTMKRKSIVSCFKGILLVTIFFLTAISCSKKATTIEFKQIVENGTFIESINGKKLTCKIEKAAIESGQEVVLICTNETGYKAQIKVTINGDNVGTISSFPAEFRYTIGESGIYQLSIEGKIYSSSKFSKFEARFDYGWQITVL